jgi:UDP-2,3-diacylglucosamine pyrophosphatase LpxH
MLLMLNNFVNLINNLIGIKKVSLSKKIKDNVKTAVKYINNFEVTAANLAARMGYKYIVCGHIHHAEIRNIETNTNTIVYLNSGDWIENLTALEYHKGKWSIYSFLKNSGIENSNSESEEFDLSLADYDPKQLFGIILKDIQEKAEK